MSARKYVMTLGTLLFVFVAVNAIFWNAVTRPLFTGWDFARLGSFRSAESLTGSKHYPEHHTEFADYIMSGRHESFDVLTIGDSFSNGQGGNYYQDCLESEYGLRVLNVRVKNHCLEDLYALCESGLLDEVSPRFVILESVERAVQGRLGEKLISPTPTTRNDVIRRVLAETRNKKPETGFLAPVMVKANATFLRDKLYHILKPERLSPVAYITELDRAMFTNRGQEDLLLYYHEDMSFTSSPLNPEIFARNLSSAAKILRDKGITLIFFAAPDKYDLYHPYIRDKSGKPANNFFTAMMSVKHEGYTVVDTLALLRSALGRGEKDVYRLDDTHWSYRGIEIFCKELAKYLLPPKLN